MKPWLYHLLVASAVVVGVVGASAWLATTALPALSRSEALAGSPVVSVVLLTFGIVH